MSENLNGMSISDKIRLLEYVKKNYYDLKNYWTDEKARKLESLINIDIQNFAQQL